MMIYINKFFYQSYFYINLTDMLYVEVRTVVRQQKLVLEEKKGCPKGQLF